MLKGRPPDYRTAAGLQRKGTRMTDWDKLASLKQQLEEEEQLRIAPFERLHEHIRLPNGGPAPSAKAIAARPFFTGILRWDANMAEWKVRTVRFLESDPKSKPLPAIDRETGAQEFEVSVSGSARNAYSPGQQCVFELLVVPVEGEVVCATAPDALVAIDIDDAISLNNEVVRARLAKAMQSGNANVAKLLKANRDIALFECRTVNHWQGRLKDLENQHAKQRRKLEEQAHRAQAEIKRLNRALEEESTKLAQANKAHADELSQVNKDHESQLREKDRVLEEMRQENRALILDEIKRRGIKYFVHFTRLGNLRSILQRGLLVGKSLEETGVSALRTDTARRDNNPNALCLSVTFPNYKMFYEKRQECDDQWCVLLLKPEAVIKTNPLFFPENAASDKSLRERASWSYRSFLAMFDPVEGKGVRPPDEPTNPQAEVQVLEDLPVKSIDLVVLQTKEDWNTYAPLAKAQGIRAWSATEGYGTQYFGPRSDWEQWQDADKR